MLIIWILQIVYCLKVDETKLVTKIAFGSCSNQSRRKNPALFNSISEWKPDLFLWIGDIIYADRPVIPPLIYSVSDLTSWRKKYISLKNYPEYVNILNSSMVTGVWDDHDYGIDDGNKYFPLKEESKEMLMEFLDDGSVRNHSGVYHSFSFSNLKVILLDIRWFRDFSSDLEGDSLGEEQWNWLELELSTNETIKVIGNGLQINAHDRQGPTERWHEKSRMRLLTLIDKYPGVILLSGDVHFAEIMKLPCSNHVFYEITSSGLTHTVFTSYGFFAYFLINFVHPFNWNIGPKYHYKNFGTIEFNWEEDWVEMSIRNSEGLSVNSHRASFQELYASNIPPSICFKDMNALRYHHFYSTLLIFMLPIGLNAISFIIFVRKYSNSY